MSKIGTSTVPVVIPDFADSNALLLESQKAYSDAFSPIAEAMKQNYAFRESEAKGKLNSYMNQNMPSDYMTNPEAQKAYDADFQNFLAKNNFARDNVSQEDIFDAQFAMQAKKPAQAQAAMQSQQIVGKGNYDRSMNTIRGLFNTGQIDERTANDLIQKAAINNSSDIPMYNANLNALNVATANNIAAPIVDQVNKGFQTGVHNANTGAAINVATDLSRLVNRGSSGGGSNNNAKMTGQRDSTYNNSNNTTTNNPSNNGPTNSKFVGFGDTVARDESGGSHESINYGSKNKPGNLKLTNMSVGDVVNGFKNGKFAAVGKYQFNTASFAEAVTALGIDPNTKMTPELQDKIQVEYYAGAKRPQIRDYILGKSDDLNAALTATSQEWRATEGPNGKGYYDNNAKTSVKEVTNGLNTSREAYQVGRKKGMSHDEALHAAILNPGSILGNSSGQQIQNAANSNNSNNSTAGNKIRSAANSKTGAPPGESGLDDNSSLEELASKTSPTPNASAATTKGKVLTMGKEAQTHMYEQYVNHSSSVEDLRELHGLMLEQENTTDNTRLAEISREINNIMGKVSAREPGLDVNSWANLGGQMKGAFSEGKIDTKQYTTNRGYLPEETNSGNYATDKAMKLTHYASQIGFKVPGSKVSYGMCASGVRKILQGAGFTIKPQSSKGYGDAQWYHQAGVLAESGFQTIDINSPNRIGDVVVTEGFDEHTHGHIEVWDGKNWVSDFRRKTKQPKIWADTPDSKIHRYRHPDNIKGGLSGEMGNHIGGGQSGGPPPQFNYKSIDNTDYLRNAANRSINYSVDNYTRGSKALGDSGVLNLMDVVSPLYDNSKLANTPVANIAQNMIDKTTKYMGEQNKADLDLISSNNQADLQQISKAGETQLSNLATKASEDDYINQAKNVAMDAGTVVNKNEFIRWLEKDGYTKEWFNSLDADSRNSLVKTFRDFEKTDEKNASDYAGKVKLQQANRIPDKDSIDSVYKKGTKLDPSVATIYENKMLDYLSPETYKHFDGFFASNLPTWIVDIGTYGDPDDKRKNLRNVNSILINEQENYLKKNWETYSDNNGNSVFTPTDLKEIAGLVYTELETEIKRNPMGDFKDLEGYRNAPNDMSLVADVVDTVFQRYNRDKLKKEQETLQNSSNSYSQSVASVLKDLAISAVNK